jgi:hypothetical protein
VSIFLKLKNCRVDKNRQGSFYFGVNIPCKTSKTQALWIKKSLPYALLTKIINWWLSVDENYQEKEDPYIIIGLYEG